MAGKNIVRLLLSTILVYFTNSFSISSDVNILSEYDEDGPASLEHQYLRSFSQTEIDEYLMFAGADYVKLIPFANESYEIARSLSAKGKHIEAINHYKLGLIEKDLWIKEHRSLVYNGMGDSYLALGEYQEANNNYRKALIPDKWSANNLGLIYHNIGASYQLLGDTQMAIEHYSLALGMDDGWINEFRSQILCNKAQLHQFLKQHHKALDDYNQAIDLNDDWVQKNRSLICNNIAISYNDLGKVFSAYRIYHSILAYDDQWINSNRSQVYFNLALILAGSKNYRSAITYCERALQQKGEEWLNNNYSIIYANIANFYRGLKMYRRAIQYNGYV